MKRILYTLLSLLAFVSVGAQSQTFVKVTLDTLKGRVDKTIFVKDTLVFQDGSKQHTAYTDTTYPDSSILFVGSDGRPTTDSANLIWNDASNYLKLTNANPTTSLVIGDYAVSDWAVNVNRSLTASGNRRGYREATIFTPSATSVAYANFDAAATMSGVENNDHFVGFQSRLTYSSSGTMTHLYGVAVTATHSGGNITNNYGFYRLDPSGAGTITNNYGIYLGAMTKGTNKYAFYSFGANDSVRISGNVWMNRNLDVLGKNLTIGTNYANTKARNLFIYGGSSAGATPNNNFNQFVIEDSKNAGISFLTPDANVSAIQFTSTSSTQAGILNFQYSTRSMNLGTIMAGGYVGFRYASYVEGFRLTRTGNVIIGDTTDGSFKLHVVGTAAITTTPETTNGTDSILAKSGSNNQVVAMAFEQGVYLPDDSLSTNLTDLTIDSAFYTRVGNIVTVSGTFTADPTTGSGNTFFYMSLPISMQSLGDTYFVGGTFNAYSAQRGGAIIYGSQNRAVFQYQAGGTTPLVFSYTFSYRLR